MRWRPGQRSRDVEDRRTSGGGGGLGGLPISLGRGGGVVGLILVIVVVLLGGGNLLGGGGGGSGFDVPVDQLPGPSGGQGSAREVPGATDPEKDLVDFMSFALDDIQSSWDKDFERSGSDYEKARLVIFRDSVSTGCGGASSAVGPFYCPADNKVYIDLGFFRELSDRFEAPGDFAQAYVLAHEVGHHVQNITGIDDKVGRLASEDSDRRNELSIRQELQADCFAGVWAHSTYQRGILESGDLDEGLAAAAAVGDDRIQEKATGRINPETWTHGSSGQRKRWFKRGFDSGDASQCDTFEGDV